MTSNARTGITNYETPSDLEFRVARVVDAPARIAFDAGTNPQHVPHWLLGPAGWTMPVCEIDLGAGGPWRMVWRKEGGHEMEMTGKYLEVTPPARVVSTERWGPEFPETIDTITFTESAGQTTISLTVKYPTQKDRGIVMATGMKEGMEASFARFDAIVAQRGAFFLLVRDGDVPGSTHRDAGGESAPTRLADRSRARRASCDRRPMGTREALARAPRSQLGAAGVVDLRAQPGSFGVSQRQDRDGGAFRRGPATRETREPANSRGRARPSRAMGKSPTRDSSDCPRQLGSSARACGC